MGGVSAAEVPRPEFVAAEAAAALAGVLDGFAAVMRAHEKQVAAVAERLGLMAYAARQANNPVVIEAVADYEARVREGRPYEDALPAEEAVARLRERLAREG